MLPSYIHVSIDDQAAEHDFIFVLEKHLGIPLSTI